MESLFFWLSKLAWLVIAPDSLFLILVFLILALLWLGKHRMAVRILSLTALSLLLIALFPVNEWLFYPLENRFPTNPTLPKKIDGIIVLSGAEKSDRSAEWNQPEFGAAVERDLAFLALAKQFPNAKLVFTGATGSMLYKEYNEADMAEMFFKQEGLDVSRVTFERASRNTFENAVNSKSIVKPSRGENWILITSAFHIPRSVGTFCKIGWPVIPYPVDHYTWPGHLLRVDLELAAHLDGMVTAVKEWIGLGAYYITGKTTSLLPADCR